MFYPSSALDLPQHSSSTQIKEVIHTKTHTHTQTEIELLRGKSSKIINLSHQSLLLISPQHSTSTLGVYSVPMDRRHRVTKC